MDTYNLTSEWQALLSVFQASDQTSEHLLKDQIRRVGLETELMESLVAAIDGDNHHINKWLFARPNDYKFPVAWTAPIVENGVRRYAWMIGHLSPFMRELRSRLEWALLNEGEQSFIQKEGMPPPLLFIDPIQVSSRKIGVDSGSEPDEFAIFQVGYPGRKSEVDDFHQRMVINAQYIVDYRIQAIYRATSVLSLEEGLCENIMAKLPLLALIHTEGHNLGHFQGPYPFDDSKKVILYEAVEEFRACLVAVRFGQFLRLSEEELDGLALCIFAVRFFGYGFDAYMLPSQRRETAREITVGLMFFQELVRKGIITGGDSGKPFSCRVKGIHRSLLDTLDSIQDDEIRFRSEGEDGLKRIAREWYRFVFPDRNLSHQAKMAYDFLSSTSESMQRR